MPICRLAFRSSGSSLRESFQASHGTGDLASRRAEQATPPRALSGIREADGHSGVSVIDHRQLVYARRQTAKPVPAPEYEDRLVSFVDILGWTRLVGRSLSDLPSRDLVARGVDVIESGLGIQRASAAGAVLGKKHDADARYAFISDTFILSTPAKSTNMPYFTIK